MRFKDICCKLTAILVATAMMLAVAAPVLASVMVSPVRMEVIVSEGKNTLPIITVTNTDEDKPVRVKAEVMGFGQNQMGTTITIKDDTSPCSAVSLIELSPEEFEIKPGESQKVSVTATIPPGASGGKYATIVVGQVPEPGMSMVGQVAIAVMLTISESSLIRAGQVTSVDISQEQPGEPITFITAISNQGNVHFRPSGEIIISQDGEEIGRTDVEPHLIIPGYTRPFKAVWNAPEVSTGGAYSYEIILDMDGSEINAKGSFTLSDTEGVLEVEGGVSETVSETEEASKVENDASEPSVPPQQQPGTSATSKPIDWRLIGEIAGGVLILGLFIYFITARRRANY
jgi:P pilus assembly chaperone PapD